MIDRSAPVPTSRIIAELAAFFFAALLLAMLPQSPVALGDLKPHPFGFAVLLASLAYGTRGGGLATLAAVAAMTVTGWPSPVAGDDYFAALARRWADPCLWLALTLLIGEMRDRQLSEQAALSAALSETMAGRDALAEHAQALRRRIAELEDHETVMRASTVVLRDPQTKEPMATLRFEPPHAGPGASLDPDVLDLVAAQLASSLQAGPDRVGPARTRELR